MATKTTTAQPSRRLSTTVGWGVTAGLVGGAVFGLLIQFLLGRMVVVGALYTLGDPSLTVGWIAHLTHSGLFGAVFALLSVSDRVGAALRTPRTAVPAGLAFGFVLWLVNIGFLWPLWLNSVGFGAGLPVPYLPVRPLVGHLLYGAGTALVFALAVD